MKRALMATVTILLLAAACSADTFTFQASLTGAQENPANGSPGTGFATVRFDSGADLLSVAVTFSGLEGTTTASHIHCCVPPGGNAMVATTVPTFTGFPLGVTSGSYFRIFDLTQASSFNPAFISAHGGTVAGAEATLVAGLEAGDAYLNIHTTLFPGGEIRGFLEPVPEPATISLLAGGIIGLLGHWRRRML